MMIIHVGADAPETANSLLWRHQFVADALRREGNSVWLITIVQFVQPDPRLQALFLGADIFIIQRSAMGLVLDQIEWVKAHTGAAVVIDFDDDYLWLQRDNPAYWHWNEGKIPDGKGGWNTVSVTPLEQMRWAGRLVDAFILPNQQIADQWSAYVPAYVIPNYPNLRYYKIPKRDNGDQIVFGWGGSFSHYETLKNSGFLTGLERAVLQVPNLQVEIATGDKRIFNILDIPNARKTYLPWVPYHRWIAYLARWDGTAAVSYTRHDSFRGLLHIIEPALMPQAVPVLASDAEPYATYWPYVAAMVKNTPGNWASRIIDLCENIEQYRAFAQEQSKPWAETYDMDKHVHEIEAVYEEIITGAFQ